MRTQVQQEQVVITSLSGSSSDMTSNYNRIVGLGSNTSLGADDSLLGHGATTISQHQFVVGPTAQISKM